MADFLMFTFGEMAQLHRHTDDEQTVDFCCCFVCVYVVVVSVCLLVPAAAAWKAS